MSVSSIAMTDAAPTAAPPLSSRRSSSFGGSQKDLYVAPEKKSVGEIMEQKEGEDEAMARYKAQLLGGAAAGAAVSEDGDKRRVVPVELRVLLEGRPDIVFDLETASVSTAAMAPMTFVLKEAANYRVQVSFRVQNEICSGLRYRQAVKRGVLTVDKTDEMLGSCAAQFRRNSSAQFRRALLSPAQPSHAGTGPTPTRSTPSPSRSASGRRRRPGCSRAGPTPPPSHSSTTTRSSTRRSPTSSRSKRGGSERAAGQPPCAYVCHVS